jgi:hypothetical protein
MRQSNELSGNAPGLAGAISAPSILRRHVSRLDLVLEEYLFSPGDEELVQYLERALGERE